MPQEFCDYMTYCRNLKFDEKPDYVYLEKMFKELAVKLEYHNDHLFDWTLLRYTKTILEQQQQQVENGEDNNAQGMAPRATVIANTANEVC